MMRQLVRSVCTKRTSLLSLPTMQHSTANWSSLRQRTLPILHGTLAALFGLILPFICWGAEATPGHPHLRAHFVFASPTHVAANPLPAARTAQDLIRITAKALAAGASHACSAPRPTMNGATTAPPAGQSTPLVLAVTVLLLAAIGLHIGLTRRDDAWWLLRTAALTHFNHALPVATPPPRLSTSC